MLCSQITHAALLLPLRIQHNLVSTLFGCLETSGWMTPNTTSVFVFKPGMIALDKSGHVAVGTSTNGMTHKVPGYVSHIDVKKMI